MCTIFGLVTFEVLYTMPVSLYDVESHDMKAPGNSLRERFATIRTRDVQVQNASVSAQLSARPRPRFLAEKRERHKLA